MDGAAVRPHQHGRRRTRPRPPAGRGLECDKLSKEGIEANFNGMMAKLIADVGPPAGKSLVATHIDSWENGAQNWTAEMREEFQKRRGYDLLPCLPVMTGRVVGSLEISERFLWDLRQTISDLVVENYAGHSARPCRTSTACGCPIEAYGGPCDDLPYAGRADEPMCEFWIGGGGDSTPCKGMASAAHTYGKPIVGAESFTADDHERWRQHPATIKALGDQAFCEGVNRFVFHRYAMQPWPNPDRPGMTMGPWGLHYERTKPGGTCRGRGTSTSPAASYMLRQGLFVADICYLQPEDAAAGLSRPRARTATISTMLARRLVLTRDERQGRAARPARRHELPGAGAAGHDRDDAEAAGQDQGVGRGRGDGRRQVCRASRRA